MPKDLRRAIILQFQSSKQVPTPLSSPLALSTLIVEEITREFLSRHLVLSRMSTETLVHAKRSFKFRPVQNLPEHIWPLPTGH